MGSITQNSVSPQNRYTRGSPCPICGGFASEPQGKSIRCFGFLSENEDFAYCTREEYAGTLEPRDIMGHQTYKHLLYGACNCGKQHGASKKPAPQPRGAIVAEYSYYDASGRLAYQTVRFKPKDFTQRRPNGKGGWTYNLQNVTRILYHLPELLKNRNVLVFIVEGEKDADNLARLGFLATTNVGGAGNWQTSCNRYLRGRHVVLLPDNDEAGREHAKKVIASLTGTAASIRTIELDVPEKGDVSDWLAAGGTPEQLESLIPPLLTSGKSFSEIETKHISWLWQQRIPRGKLHLYDGHPGLGKSLVTLDLIARVSRGDAMPDGTPGVAGAAILISAEDDASDTNKPRLEAAGAQLANIFDLSTVRYRNQDGDIDEYPFSIPRDIPILEQEIERVGAVLVILDPFMAILDAGLKARDDQDVRQALMPLARMAERTNVAVGLVRHLNKGNSDNALLRGAGSMGIIGAARSSMIIAEDPDNAEQRVLAMTKSNLAKRAENLTYRIAEDMYGRPKIEWLGISHYSTAELLSTSKPSQGRQDILNALREASEPIGARDVVDATELSYEQARKLLQRMTKSGEILSPSRGLYTVSQPSQPSQPSQSSQSSHTIPTINNNNNNGKEVGTLGTDGTVVSHRTEENRMSQLSALSSQNGYAPASQADFHKGQSIRYNGKPLSIFKVTPDLIMAEDKDRHPIRIDKENFSEIKV
jgi:putative DNA primase/helicase